MQRRKALTPEEVSNILNVSTRTLARWRSENIGPPFFHLTKKKHGKSPVRYWQSDLDQYTQDMRFGAVSTEETRRLRDENQRLTQALNTLNERINEVIDARKQQLEKESRRIKRGRKNLQKATAELEKKRKEFEEHTNSQHQTIQAQYDDLKQKRTTLRQDVLKEIQNALSQIGYKRQYKEVELGILYRKHDGTVYAAFVNFEDIIPPNSAGEYFTIIRNGYSLPILRVLTISKHPALLKAVVNAFAPTHGPLPINWSLICPSGQKQSPFEHGDAQRLLNIDAAYPKSAHS